MLINRGGLIRVQHERSGGGPNQSQLVAMGVDMLRGLPDDVAGRHSAAIRSGRRALARVFFLREPGLLIFGWSLRMAEGQRQAVLSLGVILDFETSPYGNEPLATKGSLLVAENETSFFGHPGLLACSRCCSVHGSLVEGWLTAKAYGLQPQDVQYLSRCLNLYLRLKDRVVN